jgi:hypothetical protein
VRQALPALGEYDSNILCAECDQHLGKNDDYAVDSCRTFQVGEGGLFEDLSIDAERFSKFVLSLLWRASISKRGRFCGVFSFGPYERVAKSIIFSDGSFADFRAFKLLVSGVRSKTHDIKRIITDPIRFKFERLNSYSFILGGFRFTAVLDGQELPAHFDMLMVNRTNVFRGVVLEFEQLPEFARLREIFAADAVAKS